MSCSGQQFKLLVNEEKWTPDPHVIGHTGRITWGEPGSLQLEGKAMSYINNDFNRLEKIASSIGCDLVAENIYGDLCCNRLFYDHHNDVVWDPTGYGVHDTLFHVLRLPVTPPLWQLWADTHPMKLLRYFKYRSKGYHEADPATHAFVCEQTKRYFATGLVTSRHFIETMTEPALLREFRSQLISVIGESSWNTYFHPWYDTFHHGTY
jgi:hypothetical protein